MVITANHSLLLSIVLFFSGLTVLAARKTWGIKLLGLGLMFQAVNLALVSLAEWFQTWESQVAVLVVMVISAACSVWGIGLTMQARLDRTKGSEHD